LAFGLVNESMRIILAILALFATLQNTEATPFKPKQSASPPKKPSFIQVSSILANSNATDSEEKFLSKITEQLTSKDKLPWTLASTASFIYLLLLISRVSCDRQGTFCWSPLIKLTDALHGGFCVWGSDEQTGVCLSQRKNSHQLAWYVDVLFAVAAAFIGLLVPSACTEPLFTASVAAAIFLHGYLHKNISVGRICPPDEILQHCLQTCLNSPSQHVSLEKLVFYILYVFGLVVLDFAVASFPLSHATQAILAMAVTAIWVLLSAYFGAKYSLSSTFAMSHVLVSFTGVFANSNKITPFVGWSFLAATCVGLAELLFCKSFLRKVYGHVWYDIVLHIAMIATLFPRK